MDTQTINKILGNNQVTSRFYEGCFAVDQVPRAVKRFPCSMVLNLDPSTMDGSHWVAMYIPKPHGTVYFFDSMGQPPTETMIKSSIMKNFKTIIYNKIPIQSVLSTVCAQFCIYFIYYM